MTILTTGSIVRVSIVVDRDYGERILQLAKSSHVWVVDSLDNRPMVERFWREGRLNEKADPFDWGITMFEAESEESPQMSCARILWDVEDHHGKFSQEPPWLEIEVHGAPLDNRLRGLFLELGVVSFEGRSGGFIGRRAIVLPKTEND